MQFILTSLLLVGSALAAPASNTNKPTQSCTAKSTRAHLTIENFDYHTSVIFTTPAHQNSWGYVNFTLENTGVDYKAVCSSASSRLSDFYYGDQVYDCVVPKANGAGAATYTFNAINGELQANQTWSCPKEGSSFNIEGAQKYKLDCKTKKYQNTNWTLGEIYSSETTTCKKFTKPLPITQFSAVA